MQSRAVAFAADVRLGLTSSPKRLPPHYFYDPLGSALFAAICELPEYYVTRAESEILRERGEEIARSFGTIDRLIELGSGNGRKTQLLLDAILSRQPGLTFQPVDIDADVLDASRRDLTRRFPALKVDPVCADFRQVASLGIISGRTVVLFLGSSIGNLDHDEAARLLGEVRSILQLGDALFVGFDLKKDKGTLERAYDDALGVTAAFNLNMLARINRELGGNFDLAKFAHRAFFNEAESRIEMHLVSRQKQRVHIETLELDVEFGPAETIHTENSYKYDGREIESLAAASRFRVEKTWTDARDRFSDVLFRP